jgi:hypothetical protein
MSVVAVTLSRKVVRKCRPNWRKCPLTHLYSSSTKSGSGNLFSDIDFSIAAQSQDARRRNEDPNAVMVVTGANHGIGLQFVKSLAYRSKVSDVWH